MESIIDPIDMGDFDFEVPEDQIAQSPLPRGQARMLVAAPGKVGEGILDARAGELSSFLRPGDRLVVNDTKVLRARLRGHLPSGGAVELLLLDDRTVADGLCQWEAMGRPGRKLRPGAVVGFEGGMQAEVLEILDEGVRKVRFSRDRVGFLEWMERHGHIPLPPYIRRADELADAELYQTVFAENPGAVAAPTAGLHLSQEALGALQELGVGVSRVTLHVGAGTFRPVAVENALDHPMHAERFSMDARTARELNETRARGGRIIAVGTTSLRVLESVWRHHHESFAALEGETRIFLHPQDPPRSVQGLFTNFHWPRSTLILLVAGWMGEPGRWREVYDHAIGNGYRFFSYGDCMLALKP